jgi:hypothetical protein
MVPPAHPAWRRWWDASTVQIHLLAWVVRVCTTSQILPHASYVLCCQDVLYVRVKVDVWFVKVDISSIMTHVTLAKLMWVVIVVVIISPVMCA